MLHGCGSTLIRNRRGWRTSVHSQLTRCGHSVWSHWFHNCTLNRPPKRILLGGLFNVQLWNQCDPSEVSCGATDHSVLTENELMYASHASSWSVYCHNCVKWSSVNNRLQQTNHRFRKKLETHNPSWIYIFHQSTVAFYGLEIFQRTFGP